MRLSLETVVAAPERYLAWVVGGTARAVGRMIVTNTPMMLALIGLALAFPITLWRERPFAPQAYVRRDIDALLCLVVTYTLASGALMVLVTFPASRYLDTAGIFLPALPIYVLLRVLRVFCRADSREAGI
jgi:hypothetical protein